MISKKHTKEIDKNLEFVPEKGTYAVPYVANAAGILYNKAMFEEHGWKRFRQHGMNS